MGIFKRVKRLEEQLISVATTVTEVLKAMEEVNKKLPAYEEAVSNRVDEVWNKALQEIADYDPFKKTYGGNQ